MHFKTKQSDFLHLISRLLYKKKHSPSTTVLFKHQKLGTVHSRLLVHQLSPKRFLQRRALKDTSYMQYLMVNDPFYSYLHLFFPFGLCKIAIRPLSKLGEDSSTHAGFTTARGHTTSVKNEDLDWKSLLSTHMLWPVFRALCFPENTYGFAKFYIDAVNE